MKKIYFLVLAGCLALALLGHYATKLSCNPETCLQTAKIVRGDLIARAIEATGTVKLEQVEVGTQVTGQIAAFGVDPDDPKKPLDCGSHVREGMMLAQIDPTIYRAQVDRAQAETLKAQASLEQSLARRDQTEQERNRAENLKPVEAIAESDYDMALSNFRMASANVSLWEAAVQESQAALCIAKTNFNYTIIKSPCDGVIIDRRVNVGQTVVASFNAPGIFLIAKDSPQMHIWAPIDEVDIRHIRLGLPVQFTVNAYGGKSFRGNVAQIRMNPTREDKAISYMVVVETTRHNDLLPEMTANLQFEIERHRNVLLVPNEALRETIPATDGAAEMTTTAFANASSDWNLEALFDSEEASPARTTETLREDCQNHQLWVKDGSSVRPIEVQLGATDGSRTEIQGHNIKEGMEVVWRRSED